MNEQVITNQNWLIFFPMYGIDITDAEHDLDKPMFGDCTIVSSKHVPELKAVVPMMLPNDFRTPAGGAVAVEKVFPALLAVRRKGSISVDDYPSNSPLIEDARSRAYKLSALLSIVLLAENNYPNTCALAEQVHSANNLGATLDSEKRMVVPGGSPTWGFTTKYPAPGSKLSLSREELSSKLFTGKFVALSEIVAGRRANLDVTHVKTIVRSSLAIADAIQAITPSTQLLSAVTALEILLAGNDETFASVQRRLGALLGTTAIERYNAEGILKARHGYVHEGDKLEVSLIPLRAIGLGISALARYAEAAQAFPHKQAVMDYLDFIDKADRARYAWTKEEQEAFDRFLRHKREAHYYTWQVRTLSLDYPLYKTRQQ